MTAQCVKAVKGKIMRVIILDVCGAPVTGSSGGVVSSNGFISIRPTPQYEDGTEYIQRNADDSLCINEKGEPQLKRVDLEIMLCVVDPDMIVAITGERLLSSGVTGTGVAYGEGAITRHFSLETWQDVAGPGACTSGGVQQYLYWAWPNLKNAKVGDYSIENGALTLKFTAESDSWYTGWGTMPTASPPNDYLDGTGFVTGEHFAHNVTSVAPPSSACGAALLT